MLRFIFYFTFNFFYFSFFPLCLSLFSFPRSTSIPSHCCFLSLFFSHTPLSVAERCSHFQRLCCHAPALRASLIFNVHVVRVPSAVIDRFVPEQPGLADWRLLSDRARGGNKERSREGKKHT